MANECKGVVLALLDAKYKGLWENPLPRDMLYQLALYALGNTQAGPGAGSRRGRAVILYPVVGVEGETTFRPKQRIEILDPTSRLRLAEVALRSVDLTYLGNLVDPSAAPSRLRQRQACVRMLAFGPSPRPSPADGTGGFRIADFRLRNGVWELKRGDRGRGTP